MHTRLPRASIVVLFLLAGCGAEAARPATTRPPVVVRSTPESTSANVPSAPSASVIANTDVPDTHENRSVIAFCERYRLALEARDADALLQLASPRYLEDGGTPDPSDDVDYDRLRAYLRGMFAEVEQIRAEMRYRAVRSDGQRIVVELTQASTYKIGGKYKRAVSDSQLVLERDGSSYRISSGM